MSELEQKIGFIKAVDALKEVQRKTYILSEKRFENSAEHSWAVAVLAMLLGDYAPVGTDINRVIQMLLIHDVVEVDAGDTLLYDSHLDDQKKESEGMAADRLFGLLPSCQALEFRNLWDEFEAEETSEAVFAAGLDRFIPLLHNIHTQGRAWRELGVCYEQIIARNQKIMKASPELWDYIKAQIDELFAPDFTLLKA